MDIEEYAQLIAFVDLGENEVADRQDAETSDGFLDFPFPGGCRQQKMVFDIRMGKEKASQFLEVAAVFGAAAGGVDEDKLIVVNFSRARFSSCGWSTTSTGSRMISA
jgi:hypothetical protein